MTDFSSKRLLPQLTDVLQALAASYERLLLKIRDVRLEQVPAEVAAIAEFSPHRGTSDMQDLGTSGPLAATPMQTEANLRPTVDERDPSVELSLSRHARSEPETKTDFRTPAFAEQRGDTQPPAKSDAVLRGRGENDPARAETPMTPVEDSPLRSHDVELGTDAVNRNYNFFDELDNRLAELDEDPGSDRVKD